MLQIGKRERRRNGECEEKHEIISGCLDKTKVI